MNPLRARFRALVAGLVVAAVSTVGTIREAAAEFLIGPGDEIKLSIMGLAASDVETVVGLDGTLDLVWLGRVHAADRTLDEVLQDVREMARGRIIKRYNQDGELGLIQLTDDDVFLEILEYRPVVVSGDVADPGEVVFRPGLTARRAMALAGGARSSLLSDVQMTDPVQIVRWQNEYARVALDHAVSLVRLWRIGAELDDNPEAPPPSQEQVAISADVLGDLIREQTRIMEVKRQNEEGDRAFLAEGLEKAQARLAILQQQREKQLELLASDEEEEERTRDLLEKGLAPATRLADIRRTTVLSGTRLLEIEQLLADAELDVTRLQRELNEYEEDRLAALLTDRETTYSEVLDTRLQMDLYAQNLSGTAGGLGELGMASDLHVSVLALRRSKGEDSRVELDLDSELQPGDTLIVKLEQPRGHSAGLN
ncbi:polysaccharide biosynthesis/export family protein [Ostreiculturibacter nitratireducens]|uniref:polysaccharide biosynthesis/export family protein n=1 Tax=Ostreiculturibacter nitratireducens TaxID=3075226 RepID=UPI0031B57957